MYQNSSSYNCYNHATKNYHEYFRQPGNSNNIIGSCHSLTKNVLEDYPKSKPVDVTGKCDQNTFKMCGVMAPFNDFHFYREDEDGKWTHKIGKDVITDKDASGNIIINPLTSNRDYKSVNYKHFCFCISR